MTRSAKPIETVDSIYGWHYSTIDSCDVCFDLALHGVYGNVSLHSSTTPDAICGSKARVISGCSKDFKTETISFDTLPASWASTDWIGYQKQSIDSNYEAFRVLADALEKLTGAPIVVPPPVYPPDLNVMVQAAIKPKRRKRSVTIEVPEETCQCGYYVLNNPFQARRSERAQWIALYVSLSGKVLVHHQGYKTQSYTILGAVVGNTDHADQLSELNLDVPVYQKGGAMSKEHFYLLTGCDPKVNIDLIF